MGPTALSRNRDFQFLLWGRTCQMTGGAMTALALMLHTFDTTGNSRWAGAVMAGSTVGTLVFSIPAGVLVDRWNRRTTMVGTSLGLALLLVSVPVAEAVGVAHPWHLVTISVLVGALGTFFAPAEQASLQVVVAPQELAPAASVNQARSAVANLLGPSLAGALYAVDGSLPLLADALLNLVAAFLVSRIRPPLEAAARPAGSRTLADLVAGGRFIVRHSALRAVVLMNAIASFGFGGLLALITLSFKAHRVPDAVIGGMQTAYGISGLLGALAGPWLLRRYRVSVLFIGGVLVNCACAAAMAVWNQPAQIIALLCLACLVLPPGIAGIQAFQLTITPIHLQGRVAGAMGFLTVGLAPVATGLAGILVGLPWELAITPFLAAIAVTALIAVAHPAVRGLGRVG
ncbi:MFS transporter [Luteococcus sp.]|uniref:MFS transporter n=1 Tax=Luteococcus sp. TaxID=1969402 RepID=UPI003735B9E2